jgi:hypothetical protein
MLVGFRYKNPTGSALLQTGIPNMLNGSKTAKQVAEDVKYRNFKGFRPCHARMGTSMAKFFQGRGYLTSKQAAYWRVRDKKGNMRIGIYANQLLKEIGS